MRVLEAVFFALITTTAFYWLPHIVQECRPVCPKNEIYDPADPHRCVDSKYGHLLVRGQCSKEEGYSMMASLLYNTEADAIKAIMSGWAAEQGIVLRPEHMVFYLIVWFIFTILTYGVWVPAGTFLPAIIIGCAVGSIY